MKTFEKKTFTPKLSSGNKEGIFDNLNKTIWAMVRKTGQRQKKLKLFQKALFTNTIIQTHKKQFWVPDRYLFAKNPTFFYSLEVRRFFNQSRKTVKDNLHKNFHQNHHSGSQKVIFFLSITFSAQFPWVSA